MIGSNSPGKEKVFATVRQTAAATAAAAGSDTDPTRFPHFAIARGPGPETAGWSMGVSNAGDSLQLEQLIASAVARGEQDTVVVLDHPSARLDGDETARLTTAIVEAAKQGCQLWIQTTDYRLVKGARLGRAGPRTNTVPRGPTGRERTLARRYREVLDSGAAQRHHANIREALQRRNRPVARHQSGRSLGSNRVSAGRREIGTSAGIRMDGRGGTSFYETVEREGVSVP